MRLCFIECRALGRLGGFSYVSYLMRVIMMKSLSVGRCFMFTIKHDMRLSSLSKRSNLQRCNTVVVVFIVPHVKDAFGRALRLAL